MSVLYTLCFSYFLSIVFCDVNYFTQLQGDQKPVTISLYENSQSTGSLEESCDFSHSCNYNSLDGNKWYKISGCSKSDSWVTKTNTTIMPTFPAIGFQSDDLEMAKLFSNPLPCLSEGATFNFKFWTTETATVKICFINIQTGVTNCSEIFDQSHVGYPHAIVPIMVTESQKHMVILSVVVRTGFVIIDDIGFNGTICKRPDNATNYIDHRALMNDLIDPELKNMLLNLLTRNFMFFTEYIQSKYIQSLDDILSYLGRECNCKIQEKWCRKYDGDFGTVNWRRREIFMNDKEKYVMGCYFQPGLINFAILTSPTFSPTQDKRLKLVHSGAMNHKQMIVCFYMTHSNQVSSMCTRPVKGTTTHNNWITSHVDLPNGAIQAQVIVLQDHPVPNGGSSAMISEMQIEGC